MAIDKLPNVRIGGSDKLFNGFIHSLSFNVAAGYDGEDATSLTVGVASEDGTYTISERDLNTSQVYNVEIGNFSTKMYLKDFRDIRSSRGNLLELIFTDGSFKLDKYWVGLNKTVWDLDDPDQTSKPKYLIVVGKEIHPCDANWDGKTDFKDTYDPCDPCITEEMKKLIEAGKATTSDYQKWLVDCREAGRTQIFDVQYDFDALIQAASKATGLKFVNASGATIKSPNVKYKQRYSGTLRSVLRSWAADFGWAFFFTDNAVVFIDATHTIQASKDIQDFCPNLTDVVIEHSLEGTVTGNFISHFKRAGETARDFTCRDAVYLALSAYSPDFSPPNGTLALTRDVDKVAAGLSIYSPYLRDLYWWFVKYQMWDIGGIQINKKIPELGLTILSNPITLDIAPSSSSPFKDALWNPATRLDFPKQYPLGQDVDKSFLEASGLSDRLLQVQQAILGADDVFKRCFDMLPPKEQWAFALDAENFYFFIGHYDQEEEALNFEEEHDFASGFLGKYYLYIPDLSDPIQKSFFEDDRIINDQTKCSNIELIDDGKLSFSSLNKNEDSIVYWNAPSIEADGDVTTLSKLPFAKFLKAFRNHEGGNPNADRKANFKLLTVSINGDRFFPAPVSRSSDDDNRSKFPIQDNDLIKTAHTFYLLKVGSKLDDNQEDVCAAILNADPEKYALLDQSSKDSSRVFLFLGRRAKDTDFSISKHNTWYHESQRAGYKFDGLPVNERIDTIKNRKEVMYKYPSLRCKDMGRYNNLTTHVTFKTPTASFEYSEPSQAVYGVVLEKEKRITVRVERKQKIFISGKEPTDKVLAVQVNQHDLSDDDLKRRTFSAGTCQYSDEAIRKLFEERRTALNFSQETPLIKKTFTIGGTISEVPKIQEGLMSIDMNLDAEGGLKTTYVFGTLLMRIPNQDIYNGLEFRSPKSSQVSNSIIQPYRQV